MRESFRNSPSFRRSTSPTVNVTALASFSGNDKTCAILASACPLARTLRLHFSCNSHNGPLICRPTSARAEICRPTSARAEARTRDRQPRQDSDLLFTLFVDVNSEGTRTRHDCTVVSLSLARSACRHSRVPRVAIQVVLLVERGCCRERLLSRERLLPGLFCTRRKPRGWSGGASAGALHPQVQPFSRAAWFPDINTGVINGRR